MSTQTQNWVQTKWGNLATLEYGRGLRSYQKTYHPDTPHRVFGTNGPIGWNATALYSKPSIIVGRKGAYRGIHLAEKPFFVIDTAFYLLPKASFDIRWAYYQLVNFDINQLDSGSAIPSTTRDAFYEIPVSLPPFPIQRRIAGILSAYDDLIENNQRRIAILEAMARGLYREWFVHYRYPGHEGVPLVDSTLGPIPHGWEVGTLGEMVEIRKGKNITKDTVKEGTIPVIAGGISAAYYHDTPNTKAPVITISASGANAGFVNLHFADIWASDCSYIDTSSTPHIYYIYSWFDHHRTNITHLQRGSAQPHVYPKDLVQLSALIPPERIKSDFESHITSVFRHVSMLRKQNDNLRRTRDLLLPRLLSGQIAVGDVE
jgi:type I restriction enzyme S subunit